MLRNGAVALLLACAFALSLFYRSYEDPLQFPVMALLAGGFLLALPRREISLPSSATVVALIALTVLTLLTFAVSTIPFSSQIALCVFIALPLTFFTTSCIVAAKARQDVLIFALPVFLILSFWAIAQSLFTGMRAPGPFLDPNMLAAILSIGLLCATGFALEKKKPVYTLPAFILFSGLIATGSRSGLAASMIAMATLIFASGIRLSRKTLIQMALIALSVLLLLGASLLHQLGNIANLAAPSVTDRLDLWHAAWQIALAHPFFGTGPGTFHFYYPAWRMPADQSLGNFAHSDPLQMAAEMGFAAPVLLYGLLLCVFLHTRAAVKRTVNETQRLAILTPFAALLTVALQAHINYPLYLLPVMIACGVLLALWHRATFLVTGEGVTSLTLSRRSQIFTVSGGLLLALCVLGLSFTASAGFYYLKKSREAADPQTVLIALGHAEIRGPLSFIDPEVEMARTNLHLLNQTDNIKSEKLKRTLLAETKRLLDNAAYWNPAWAEIDFLRGQMEQTEGSKLLMVTDWKEALRKNPMHFAARENLAEALLAEGRRDDAINIVTGGLQYPHTIAYREWAVAFLMERKSP
ncbi:MAG: putative bicarbonate transporter, family protein [Micavibrio sp.]|nr:putative bicarbonate transporter, family protein [Micavibrio sp.]